MSMFPLPSVGASAKMLSACGEMKSELRTRDLETKTYLTGGELLTPCCQWVAESVLWIQNSKTLSTEFSLVYLRFFIAQTIAFIKLGESIQNDILLVSSLCSVAEDGQEHGEVDWAGCLLDHRFKFCIGADSTQRVEGGANIVFRQETILVLIDETEGFFEFSHLMLSEPVISTLFSFCAGLKHSVLHCKNIGARSSSSLFGASFDWCFFSCSLGRWRCLLALLLLFLDFFRLVKMVRCLNVEMAWNEYGLIELFDVQVTGARAYLTIVINL